MDTEGLLYLDVTSSQMYRCLQRQWRPWHGHFNTADPRSTPTQPAPPPHSTHSTGTGSTGGSGGTSGTTGTGSTGGRRRVQSSVRRAASTPHNSPNNCPTGTLSHTRHPCHVTLLRYTDTSEATFVSFISADLISAELNPLLKTKILRSEPSPVQFSLVQFR